MTESGKQKIIRKCMLKQKRAQQRLLRDLNIEYSEDPTKYVAVCNAGLVTGLSRENLEEIIKTITLDFNLIMPSGKSYSFIEFDSVETADRFYSIIHGHREVPGQDNYFCLLYIKSLPASQDNTDMNEIPDGLRLIENFITLEQENLLLESVDWDNESCVESELKHRKVKHFGYEFRYDNNKVDLDKPIAPIPEAYNFLQQLFEKHDCGQFKYDQLTINKYLPGQGIPPHVDTHSVFENTILSLSLGSSCVMDFKRGDKKFSLYLPSRSLLILSKQARYGWSHGICPRTNDDYKTENGLTTKPRGVRVSFTFRKVRSGDCECTDFEYCDSNKNISKCASHSSINSSIASKLELSYVHAVYDEISEHFHETRHKPWPNVIKFIDTLQTGSILLDVGCGNGKYLSGHPHLFKIGCDRNAGLLEICQEKGFQTLLSDCLYLPYKLNSVDAILCIAVIHHLSTEERRKQAILEIIRVLRVGGKALIYVWAKEQNKDSVNSAYLKLNCSKNKKNTKNDETPMQLVNNEVYLPIHENRTEFKHSDVLVPWKHKGGKQYMRYYHVFECGELENLCSDIPFSKIDNLYYDQGNWCIVLQKV